MVIFKDNFCNCWFFLNKVVNISIIIVEIIVGVSFGILNVFIWFERR